ncbi:MAG: ATP-binding protein [Verrucomicrobiota bacterium]
MHAVSTSSGAGSDHVKQISVVCDLSAAREGARALTQFLGQLNLNEETLFACELSLTEAATNAVVHAKGPQRFKPVLMEAAVHESTIALRVTDHTDGFDHPGNVPPPDADVASGRGLYLIQSMMDEVRYERAAHGNTLAMIKRLPDAPR